jgi:CheY-like chemotaxis protein
LAGGDWRPRALVLAQLVEEGYDVTVVETWDEAELLLRKRAVQPAAVVFDLEGEPHPEDALATLGRLVAPDRAVILTSASALPAAAVRSTGFEHVLARPYSVGDVVQEVSEVLR